MNHHPLDPVDYMREVAARAVGESTGIDFERPPSHVEPVVAHLETANLHKDAGAHLPPSTRMHPVKHLALRIARLHTTQQTAFNQASLAALHALDYNINTARIESHERLARLERTVTDLDHSYRQLLAQLDRLHERIVGLEGRATELGDEQAVRRTDTMTQRARLDLFLREVRSRLPEPLTPSSLEAVTADLDASLAPLYAQLEEAFRGSREQIKNLQQDYLADIVALRRGPVVDIGCGRGEWLELLGEHDVAAYGVDTNETFVTWNVERGLDVRHGDAIEHLLSIEPESVAAVTAFHVIEHVAFTDAVRLVDAALVALRPGGLLVFETPNPTNLVVGASTFYLDPTHRKPLHPGFLHFLVEARGFIDVETRYLHPSTEPRFPLPDDPMARPPTERLNQALFGAQDYAVIGRKAGGDT